MIVPEERAYLPKTVSTLSQVPPSRNQAEIKACGGTCDKVLTVNNSYH